MAKRPVTLATTAAKADEPNPPFTMEERIAMANGKTREEVLLARLSGETPSVPRDTSGRPLTAAEVAETGKTLVVNDPPPLVDADGKAAATVTDDTAKDAEIAALKTQLAERDKTIADMKAARGPHEGSGRRTERQPFTVGRRPMAGHMPGLTEDLGTVDDVNQDATTTPKAASMESELPQPAPGHTHPPRP